MKSPCCGARSVGRVCHGRTGLCSPPWSALFHASCGSIGSSPRPHCWPGIADWSAGTGPTRTGRAVRESATRYVTLPCGWPAKIPGGGIAASKGNWSARPPGRRQHHPPHPRRRQNRPGATRRRHQLAHLPASAVFRTARDRLLPPRHHQPAQTVCAVRDRDRHPTGTHPGRHGPPDGRVDHPTSPQPGHRPR